MKLAFDLHLHSCLSPCGDTDMTPANIAAMCKLAGLDVVALTDHNTTGNCDAFCKAAKRQGLLALPGMELCTREEVHVVCLFPDLESAEAFNKEIYRRLPEFRNEPAVFGAQILMNEEDTVLGEETRALISAVDVGLYDVPELAAQFGAVAFPAHIDRPSNSLLSQMGIWDSELKFPLAERSPNCPEGLFDRFDLRGLRNISGCDAHYLDQITDARQWMELPERTEKAVLAWLKGKDC